MMTMSFSFLHAVRWDGSVVVRSDVLFDNCDDREDLKTTVVFSFHLFVLVRDMMMPFGDRSIVLTSSTVSITSMNRMEVTIRNNDSEIFGNLRLASVHQSFLFLAVARPVAIQRCCSFYEVFRWNVFVGCSR